jgi:hypothetical protein
MLVRKLSQRKWIASDLDLRAGDGDSQEMCGVEVELEKSRTSTLPLHREDTQ